MAEDILKDRILEIYKSDDGIHQKIAELKGAFPDGEIIEKVENLFDEGILKVRSGKGAGKEAFLIRREDPQEVDVFKPDVLEYAK